MPSSGFPFPAASTFATSPTFMRPSMRRTLPGSVRASAGRKRGNVDSLQPTTGAAEVLRTQLQRAFHAALVDVDGLDDGEYFWEPVTGCWSVRRRRRGRAGLGHGRVGLRRRLAAARTAARDDDRVAARPPLRVDRRLPVVRVRGSDRSRSRVSRCREPRAGHSTGSTGHNGAFTNAVASLHDEDLDDLRPAHWGGLLPIEFLVSTIAVEHVHHGGEISLLRDLRRGVARPLTR